MKWKKQCVKSWFVNIPVDADSSMKMRANIYNITHDSPRFGKVLWRGEVIIRIEEDEFTYLKSSVENLIEKLQQMLEVWVSDEET